MLDMARRSDVTEEFSLFREQVRRFFERALTRIYGGTNEIMKEVIGRAV